MSGRRPAAIAASAAIAAFIVGSVLGTHVAGGSDSSCYLNAARLLSRGSVALNQPLARAAPWANAAVTFAPSGFTSSRLDPSRLVPICSPGLPLAMAVFRTLRLSEFLVVPWLGALCVWLTYLVGRRIDRPLTGALSAMLLVCSPTFLYQIVQPMSDVPAATWWLLAISWTIEREDGSNSSWLAGLAASMALQTRPNLLPLAGVVAAYLFVMRAGHGGLSGVTKFATGMVPGAVVLALLQRAMYGSPFATGYGDVNELMSVTNVIPNTQRYVGWLLVAHAGFPLLALGAPVLMRRRRQAWLLLALSGTTLACYLPYVVFDDWWYTRFLLPAIPLLVILSVAVLVAIAGRFAEGFDSPARSRSLDPPTVVSPSTLGLSSVEDRALRTGLSDREHPRPSTGSGRAEHGQEREPRLPARVVSVACIVVLMILWINFARARHAFDLSDWEQHYYRAGIAVSTHVAGPAAIVTVRDSGSVQYHSGMPTVSWDTLEPGSLDQALMFVRDRGYPPYLLLEIDEEPAFRERFSRASAIGNLDWPPRVQVGRTIRLYDPLDRARFLADGRVRTEFVRDAPVPARDWRRWMR
jgi:hypothetical protein